MKRTCRHCGVILPEQAGRGRRRRYCSDSCKQLAYLERQTADNAATPKSARQPRESGQIAKTPPTTPLSDALSVISSKKNGRRYDSIPLFRKNAASTASERYFLWLDARQGKDAIDWTAALTAGVERFEQKTRWGGQSPQVVKAHPDSAGNGLKPVAAELGLVVVGDATITPGTYRLGLKGGDR